jgi:hypothetical protein
LPQMGLKLVKKHLLGHISSFYYCNLENIFFGASMAHCITRKWTIHHSKHILLLVQKKKIKFFSKMTFGFCRRPRENDVWNENYKWPHLAPDFSTDLVKLGPKLT